MKSHHDFRSAKPTQLESAANDSTDPEQYFSDTETDQPGIVAYCDDLGNPIRSDAPDDAWIERKLNYWTCDPETFWGDNDYTISSPEIKFAKGPRPMNLPSTSLERALGYTKPQAESIVAFLEKLGREESLVQEMEREKAAIAEVRNKTLEDDVKRLMEELLHELRMNLRKKKCRYQPVTEKEKFPFIGLKNVYTRRAGPKNDFKRPKLNAIANEERVKPATSGMKKGERKEAPEVLLDSAKALARCQATRKAQTEKTLEILEHLGKYDLIRIINAITPMQIPTESERECLKAAKKIVDTYTRDEARREEAERTHAEREEEKRKKAERKEAKLQEALREKAVEAEIARKKQERKAAKAHQAIINEMTQVLDSIIETAIDSSDAAQIASEIVAGAVVEQSPIRNYSLVDSATRQNAIRSIVNRKKLRETKRKTEMCRSFFSGIPCAYGDGCRYAHSQEELQPSVCRHASYCKLVTRGLDGKWFNHGDVVCREFHPGETESNRQERIAPSPNVDPAGPLQGMHSIFPLTSRRNLVVLPTATLVPQALAIATVNIMLDQGLGINIRFSD